MATRTKTAVINVRCHQAFADRIQAQADFEGLNRSEWIVKVLSNRLDRANRRRLDPTVQGQPVKQPPALEHEVP